MVLSFSLASYASFAKTPISMSLFNVSSCRGGVTPPLLLKSIPLPSTKTSDSIILFSVIVPVLSVAITVTLPSVSAARSLFITALLFASLYAPRPRTIVIIIGSSSGIVAKARPRPVKTISLKSCP